MATSINMRGKAATSGAGGGGGKSKLRQEWDNLLDHPNPATQQQFEEDYAMADPSSNLFNPRKVLSNRNNLKNYANKKGIPPPPLPAAPGPKPPPPTPPKPPPPADILWVYRDIA